MGASDRDLGMERPITRRDFLNGVRVTVAGSLLSSVPMDELGLSGSGVQRPAQDEPGYYPPALTGLRGDHEGSWEVAHQMRDGTTWEHPKSDPAGPYDLVIVGAGISGLTAGYLFRQEAGDDAKVLILDNHDDFGGHAKRNEFRTGDRSLIGYGGTQSIDTPSAYSEQAIGLLRELGIELERFHTAFDQDLYTSLGLSEGVFFDRDTFGVDRTVAGYGELPWKQFAERGPLAAEARKDLVRLHEDSRDYMRGLSKNEKISRLVETSYRDYLKDFVGVHPQVLSLFQTRTHGLYGLGIDAVPAVDCWGLDYPGFQGLGFEERPYEAMGSTAQLHRYSDPYIYHFPDGNASIARLLVRELIPGAAAGHTMEDIVTTRFDYAKLDEDSWPVRIRLNSTAVHVAHRGSPERADEVEVTYVRDGQAWKARGRSCILACWNGVIPYLCPELPEEQKRALDYGVKVPIVYTNVLVRNWKAFEKLGIHSAYCPGSYHYEVSLDFPVSLGEYDHPSTPDQPMILHHVRTPCRPGIPSRQQHKAGRVELLGTTFETFERETRSQLGRMLSEGGFDPARDIQAITVNRWPHGYAYEYNSLFDPDWSYQERPCVVGRQPYGRISIANADAQAYAYTDAAIDQAYRAVEEIIERGR